MASINSGSIPAGLIVDASTLLAQAQTQNTGVTTADFLKAAANVSQSAQQSPLQQGQIERSDAQQKLQTFWEKQMEEIQHMTANEFKTQELPLARIKKIMKMDEDVKMISAEAPLLFSKAAQIFITELSLRAWIHTEDSKRRTLQRNDIAMAITKFDQFDFLIDIVPREELKPAKPGGADQVQFYYTLPQQTRPTVAVNNTSAPMGQGTLPVSALQTGQILLAQQSQNGQPMTLTPINVEGNQILQLAQTSQQPQQTQAPSASALLLNAASSDNVAQTAQVQKIQSTAVTTQSTEPKQQPQITQTMLQQLVGNLPNSSPGEMHSIQINSQGQLQLVKVANTQNQNVVSVAEGSSTTAQGAQRLVGGTDTSDMYELAAGIARNVDTTSGDTNHGLSSTMYVRQDEN